MEYSFLRQILVFLAAVVLAAALVRRLRPLAMSSAAVVVKQFTEQSELNTAHGRAAVGILLFRDVAVRLSGKVASPDRSG